MNRLSVMSVLVVVGCTTNTQGTQVGFEETLRCEQVSADLIEDLSLPLDDFGGSSATDLVDPLLGTFADADDDALLTVAQPVPGVQLVRFADPATATAGVEMAILCNPQLRLDVQLDFVGTDLAFSEAAIVVLEGSSNPGVGFFSVTGASLVDGLAEPTLFEPTEMDEVKQSVVGVFAPDSWTVELGWLAEFTSDDGTAGLTAEKVVSLTLNGDE